MKKSLIALAVLASTGAMAQSSVTLYGIADVNLQSSKAAGLRQTKVESGGVNGSRFGLKGSEDLGGGLKALFVLEGGFNIDNGSSSKAGSLFNRQSYVGLAGNFGEFRIGNVRTAYDDTSINSDPLWDSLLAPAYSVWTNNYNPTPGNSVYYSTPSFGGLTAAVSYALGENKSNATATAGAKKEIGVGAVNVQYSAGPIYASIAYQEDKLAKRAYGLAVNTLSITPVAPAAAFATASAAANSAAVASYKTTLVNASYDLGVAKLEGSYNRNVQADNTKSDQYQIGVDVPVSPALTLSTGYAYSKDKLNGVSGDKRDGFGLGAKYSLSKRTFVYTGAVFGETKPAAGGNKVKTDIYAIGLNHSF
ncbi:porin [Rhodoferax sp.]|uniref:porin n=1 Tax=Rhodoferax sp. TaxID=50421 RepID=UPI0025EE5CDF|nr:porin [Rhodoferax sp.]